MIRVHQAGSTGYNYFLALGRSSGEKIPHYHNCTAVELCRDVDILWQFESDSELDYLGEIVRRLKFNMRGLADIYLTIMHMPYMSDAANFGKDCFICGEMLHNIIIRINAMDIAKVRVLDPKNLNEVLGLKNQEFYTMTGIAGQCECVVNEIYDYVCYMSQFKKWKYDTLGVVGKSTLTYIGDLNTDGKGVIMGADQIANANVLIIDDTCYKGTTYAKVISLLKDMGADNVDVYVSQLSKEGRGIDGIVKTGVRNVFTLTGKDKVTTETITGNGKNVPLYHFLVGNIVD